MKIAHSYYDNILFITNFCHSQSVIFQLEGREILKVFYSCSFRLAKTKNMEISLGSFKNNKQFAEVKNANFMSRIILRQKKNKIPFGQKFHFI